MKKVVAAKLHGITVTDANLNYHGSITLDPEHCIAVGILPLEFVDIWNKNSGARISTYVIYGVPGSRCCVLNGAAARTCQVDDQIIICSSDYIEPGAFDGLRTKILTFKDGNRTDELLTYAIDRGADGQYSFEIRSVAA